MATRTKRTAATALRQLRAERGFTQEQLEHVTGVSQTLISQIENGSRRMTYGTAGRLELALGLPRGELDDVIETRGYITDDDSAVYTVPAVDDNRDVA